MKGLTENEWCCVCCLNEIHDDLASMSTQRVHSNQKLTASRLTAHVLSSINGNPNSKSSDLATDRNTERSPRLLYCRIFLQD